LRHLLFGERYLAMVDKINVHINKKGKTVIFRLEGRLDSISSTSFKQQFLEALEGEECSKVLLNLENLHYISSSGLKFFHSQTRELKQKNIRLIICSINENTLSIIKLSGFDNILNITDTETEALSTV
jgi:anti-sigma B factor antagonist